MKDNLQRTEITQWRKVQIQPSIRLKILSNLRKTTECLSKVPRATTLFVFGLGEDAGVCFTAGFGLWTIFCNFFALANVVTLIVSSTVFFLCALGFTMFCTAFTAFAGGELEDFGGRPWDHFCPEGFTGDRLAVRFLSEDVVERPFFFAATFFQYAVKMSEQFKLFSGSQVLKNKTNTAHS